MKTRLRSLCLLAAIGLVGVPACKPADAATVLQSSPSPLATASRSGTLSAADFAKLATVPAGSALPSVFISDELDLVADSVGTTKTIVPQTASRFWVSTVATFVVTSVAGTCTTAPQLSAGTDVSHVNLSAQGTTLGSTATINSTGVRLRASLGNLVAPSLDAGPLLGELKVQAVGTGGFSLKGRWIAVGYISAL